MGGTSLHPFSAVHAHVALTEVSEGALYERIYQASV